MYLKMYMFLCENKILVQLPHVNKIAFKLTCMSMEFQLLKKFNCYKQNVFLALKMLDVYI